MALPCELGPCTRLKTTAAVPLHLPYTGRARNSITSGTMHSPPRIRAAFAPLALGAGRPR
jgi:hypothetical protein